MDGIHDLGGMQGFGPVEVEPDEPVFHAPWEGRTFALAGAALGAGGFNTPMFRHAIERMEPGHYLTSSYYEHWLTAVTTLLVEAGMVSAGELPPGYPLSLPVRVGPADVPELEAHGGKRVPERTYTVRFEATELWGDGADHAGAVVLVDLYDRYLEGR